MKRFVCDRCEGDCKTLFTVEAHVEGEVAKGFPNLRWHSLRTLLERHEGAQVELCQACFELLVNTVGGVDVKDRCPKCARSGKHMWIDSIEGSKEWWIHMDADEKKASFNLGRPMGIFLEVLEEMQGSTFRTLESIVTQTVPDAQVEKDVTDIVSSHIGVESGSLHAGASLVDIGADSLDIAEIEMEIEDKFDVDISRDDKNHTTTVSSLVMAVLNALKVKGK